MRRLHVPHRGGRRYRWPRTSDGRNFPYARANAAASCSSWLRATRTGGGLPVGPRLPKSPGARVPVLDNRSDALRYRASVSRAGPGVSQTLRSGRLHSPAFPRQSRFRRAVCSTLRGKAAYNHAMTNRFLSVVITVVLQCGVSVAADVSVHVSDPHDQVIPGAIVSLTGRNAKRWTASTDSKGECALPNVSEGEYFLEAEAPGFDPSPPRTIDLRDDKPLSVSISLGIASVRSSVVVTATGMPQTADELSK